MTFSRRINYVCTNNVKINIVPPYDKYKFKRETLSRSVTTILFNHLLGLSKYVIAFSYLSFFLPAL